jgi:uncharacterized protein (TIGR02453 family)
LPIAGRLDERVMSTFDGFPKETIRFLSTLKKNNDKKWFDAHREDYEQSFLEPAKKFVEAIAPRLRKIDRSIQAEPKVNGSIMRINRDVRFSKDKSPYKDHLDLWFWSGEKKGWDKSGFFFRLTPNRLMLGAGMHGFEPPALDRYRKAVLDKKRGDALVKAVESVRRGGYEVGGETYKKPPKGTPPDHPRTDLLKHSGLYAGWDDKHPSALHKASFVDFVAKHFAATAPIHDWLCDL